MQGAFSSACCASRNASAYILYRLAVTTKSLEDLPEAVTELCRLADSLLHFTVILLFCVIEILPVDVHQFALPRDAHVIFLYDLIGQLLLNLGL